MLLITRSPPPCQNDQYTRTKKSIKAKARSIITFGIKSRDLTEPDRHNGLNSLLDDPLPLWGFAQNNRHARRISSRVAIGCRTTVERKVVDVRRVVAFGVCS